MKGIVENRSLKKGLLQEVRQFFKVNVAAQPFIILGRIKLSCCHAAVHEGRGKKISDR